jgi:hypothetical protein
VDVYFLVRAVEVACDHYGLAVGALLQILQVITAFLYWYS